MSTRKTAHMTSLATPPHTLLCRLASVKPSTLAAAQQHRFVTHKAVLPCITAAGVQVDPWLCPMHARDCAAQYGKHHEGCWRTHGQQVLVALQAHLAAHVLLGLAGQRVHVLCRSALNLRLDLQRSTLSLSNLIWDPSNPDCSTNGWQQQECPRHCPRHMPDCLVLSQQPCAYNTGGEAHNAPEYRTSEQAEGSPAPGACPG